MYETLTFFRINALLHRPHTQFAESARSVCRSRFDILGYIHAMAIGIKNGIGSFVCFGTYSTVGHFSRAIMG